MSVLAISKHGKALSDISKQSRNPSASAIPDEHRSFLSRTFFLWIGPLLSKGAEKTLIFDDLPSLKQRYRSVNLLRYWKPSKRQLLPNLIWHYRKGLSCAILAKLISIVLDYTNPLLLHVLINSATNNKATLTQGLTIAVLMFVVAELKSLLWSYHNFITSRDCALALSVMMNTVAKKSLSLAPESRAKWPSSRIVNLVTVDVENISNSVQYFHFAWSAVVSVFIALTFIYFKMGPPAFGAIFVVMAYIPFNIIITRIVRSYQVQQMKIKDQRVKFMKEVIGGMKVVKLFTWEEPFAAQIDKLRRQEIALLARSAITSRMCQALNSAAPFVVAIVCFTWFVLINEPSALTPEIAFTSLVVFNMLRRPMGSIAPSIHFLTKAAVSLGRVDDFLASKDLKKEKQKHEQQGEEHKEVQLLLHHASFTFSSNCDKEELKDINLELNEGDFHIITGSVGCGKSALLSAIIGDLNHVGGIREVRGKIGYLPQTPWIMNTTVKGNILYGQDFNKNKYEKVTKACDLKKDFFALPRYDSTVVGDNGVQLSGGQRARLALARALYQDCDIYLLDDPFAALDTNVSRTVYENLFGSRGLLAEKTILLATHNVNLAKNVDMIHVMENGSITDSGSYDDLYQRNSKFASLATTVGEPPEPEPKTGVKKRGKAVMFEPPEVPESKRHETVQEGRISAAVYMKYIRAYSFKWAGTFVLLLSSRYALQLASTIWLAHWSDKNAANIENFDTREEFLTIYMALGLGVIVVNVIAFVSSTFGAIRASIKLHAPFVTALLRAPMAFYDNTPLGRILSRLSADIDVIDNALPINIRVVTDHMINITSVMVLISINIPVFIIFVIPFVIFYILLLRRFLPSSRQIRRIESAQRSTVLSSLAQNINGASSIRAYDRTKMTCLNFHNDVDGFTRCRYLQPATQMWLSLRLELLGNCMVFICAIMVVVGNYMNWVTAGTVGLCMTYAMTLTEFMNLCVRMMNQAENNIIAVERVKEFHDIQSEAGWSSEYPLIDAWPHSGGIEFMKYNLHYNRDTHALKNITLAIRGGEKIGIVGRTGSGKSSLVAALLRLVEGHSGDIKIDGVNIAEIGLHELRNRISIIPQDPVLFSSSVRFNIDPFNQFADSDLWIALEACQLKDFIAQQKGGLSWIIEEGGSNMSLGQRQLVCLCRALLKGGQILILDEATAAVDRNTEQLVHQVVGDHFKQSTTLIIAHRLDTVKNCDRILVLDNGVVAEFDKPDVLLAKEDSLFREMIKMQWK